LLLIHADTAATWSPSGRFALHIIIIFLFSSPTRSSFNIYDHHQPTATTYLKAQEYVVECVESYVVAVRREERATGSVQQRGRRIWPIWTFLSDDAIVLYTKHLIVVVVVAAWSNY
jgi:hypothetical protein